MSYHDLSECTLSDDERLATDVGLLSAKIFLGLHRRGVLIGVAS